MRLMLACAAIVAIAVFLPTNTYALWALWAAR